jgi:acetoin utilization deacetylase AcuC-like enzyme
MIKNLLFKNQNVYVVFSHEYAGIPTTDTHQTFDILKYKKIRDTLVEQKLLKRKKILKPYMVSYEDIALVHSDSYINQIKDPMNVARILNLGHVNPWDSYILEYFRIVSGGTVLAAKHALQNGAIVFNLGGGFHHARKDKGAGFCLINDIAIAIQKMRKKRRAQKFLIIDLDYHQGDGNLTYFKDDNDVYTFSIHASSWETSEKQNNFDGLVDSDCSWKDYKDLLEANLQNLCLKFKPDLVFYLAGSDPYEKDTLCDMKLTRDDLHERNMYILSKINNLKIPIVITAGGGYGPDSWEIYYDFIKSALSKNGIKNFQ